MSKGVVALEPPFLYATVVPSPRVRNNSMVKTERTIHLGDESVVIKSAIA
jgi:hypothetical protein